MTTRSISPRHPRPAVVHAAQWAFPTPETATLDNGLQVWAYRLPGQHVPALDLTIDLDLNLEPGEREGVATMALRVSDEGGLDHRGADLAGALESAGALYDGRVTHHHTGCSLDAPITRIDTALELFNEIITRPEYRSADLARHVALRVAEIAQARASGPATANRALREVLWGTDQRQGRPAGGTPASLADITRDEVSDFHDRHWRPDRARVVVAGDHDHLIGLVADALGGWQADGDPAPKAAAPLLTSLTGSRVVHLVDRPEAVQVDLRIAGAGLDRRHPQLAALQLAGVAVGGSFLSRLNRRIREELGYSYGIGFSHHPSPVTATWQVATSVRTEVATEALVETLTLLDLTADLTDDEVADARAQLITIAPLRYETAGALVGQAGALASDGLDPTWINQHYARLAATDAEHASQAFREHTRERTIVLVGAADALAPALTSRGFEVRVHELENYLTSVIA